VAKRTDHIRAVPAETLAHGGDSVLLPAGAAENETARHILCA
jgi:hypothetical protein